MAWPRDKVASGCGLDRRQEGRRERGQGRGNEDEGLHAAGLRHIGGAFSTRLTPDGANPFKRLVSMSSERHFHCCRVPLHLGPPAPRGAQGKNQIKPIPGGMSCSA
jgi:hypothetical protein